MSPRRQQKPTPQETPARAPRRSLPPPANDNHPSRRVLYVAVAFAAVLAAALGWASGLLG